MKDIENRADIDLIMNAFYKRALVDDAIGYFFSEVVHLDLEHHLPIIGDFWESTLFGSPTYSTRGRNPLAIHKHLHQLSPLTAAHFNRWLQLFTTVVDEEFEGERAGHLKMRAEAIAARMQEALNIGSDGVNAHTSS
jgi:hemoglobin